ncbi:hypothetical protein AAHC03_019424 [Spirometra sp. Aus1]
MRTWESKTCVSFVEKESHHQSYINFTMESFGCCSHVGRQSNNGPQTISVSPDCESDAGVIQELGHILGF